MPSLDKDDELFAAVLPGLRALADHLMKGEVHEHTLPATELIDHARTPDSTETLP